VRITGGTMRGTVVRAPNGPSVRPTPDRVRVALFNLLGDAIVQARFLDMFAGTGIVGLEAASRGVSFVLLVEKRRKLVQRIRMLLEAAGVGCRAMVETLDAFSLAPRLVRRSEPPFDVVFLDPPYKLTSPLAPGTPVGDIMEDLALYGLLTDDGVVVVEHASRSAVAPEWESFAEPETRRYGDVALSFFRGRES